MSLALSSCATYERPRYTFNVSENIPAATILFRMDSVLGTTDFSISQSSADCHGFAYAGYINHKIEGFRVPGVSDLIEGLNKAFAPKFVDDVRSFERTVPVGGPIQIQGKASFSNGQTASSCGPLTGRMTPIAEHKYLAEFHWKKNQCFLSINDITDSNGMSNALEQSTNECSGYEK